MTDSTTLEANKRLVRHIPEDVLTNGRLDLLDDVYAGDAVEHHTAGDQRGLPAIRESFEAFLAAFPDVTQTVEDVVADGDTVAMRLSVRGTHDGGGLMGFDPTGREIDVQQMVFARVEDGKVAERWVLWDTLGLFEQLGIVELPGT